jgi:DNA-binding response OmpR family regulator
MGDSNRKCVLLVDDDPLVLRIYGSSLTAQGFAVETATDGLAAMKALRAVKPQVIVLDLMMPKFSGVEVLKFMRAQPDMATLPVVVLSNAYMDDLTRGASLSGVQKILLKVRCTPAILFESIQEVLAAPKGSQAVPPADGGAPTQGRTTDPYKTTQPHLPGPGGPAAKLQSAAEAAAKRSHEEMVMRAKAREEFLRNSGSTCATLRALFQSCRNAPNEKERDLRLQDLYRKIHFMAAAAGLAECHPIAQLATVVEALLFQVMDQPSRFTNSVSRTIAATVDFLEQLFQRVAKTESKELQGSHVLVVDDDPVSNRLVSWALRQAQLEARSVEDPRSALQFLREKHYDLVLLDVELPGMDGFELCTKLRAVPGYEQVPVIYVTAHSDFENRAKGALTGGYDLIAKPILPMELAVKVLTVLMKKQLMG